MNIKLQVPTGLFLVIHFSASFGKNVISLMYHSPYANALPSGKTYNILSTPLCLIFFLYDIYIYGLRYKSKPSSTSIWSFESNAFQ